MQPATVNPAPSLALLAAQSLRIACRAQLALVARSLA